ncbi:hypothetical protein LJR010_000506 [Ensifer adhaerens]|uniref:hypothetical protein n=1 Tax=Ensifer adhaerens TaxID=106592 RepID=UPI00399BED91
MGVKGRKNAANFPEQIVYSFVAAARILGRHVTTLHRQAKDGRLRTVDTPVGRRVHRDEIRRQIGERTIGDAWWQIAFAVAARSLRLPLQWANKRPHALVRSAPVPQRKQREWREDRP